MTKYSRGSVLLLFMMLTLDMLTINLSKYIIFSQGGYINGRNSENAR